MPDQLHSGLKPSHPVTMTHVASGEVLIADGVTKPQRWDGLMASTENAGIPAAPSGVAVAEDGGTAGTITGGYSVAVRFLDDEGIPGDLSPLAEATFASASSLNYSSVPVSSDPRVVKRQIFRTLAGESTVVYLEGEIDDNTTTTFVSTKDDETLAAATALPILKFNGKLNARRFGVPPHWKPIVVSHQNRTFWLGTPEVSEGHAEVTNASSTVAIVGGFVTDQFVDRQLHIKGHDSVYDISAASPAAGLLTISQAYGGDTNLFAEYAILPEKTEFHRIYFSEYGEPESVPSVNAVDRALEEGDNEPETAGIVLGSFIWIATPRKLYRWTYQNHPVDDGNIFLAANRGCLNQRTWAAAEGNAYILDREGIYSFNGGTPVPISAGIQTYFRPGGIVWDNSRYFHAAHYPSEETVKFFVCLDGSLFPRHALVFHYRSGDWWEEEYAWPIASSCTVPVAGRLRLLVGSSHNRVLLTSEGTLDGPKGEFAARLPVASGGTAAAVLSGGTYTDADILNAPVTIVEGTGKGQTRIILDADGNSLELDRPWDEIPDSTSVVQIGGVPWRMRTKWFRVLENTTERTRAWWLSFTPADSTSSLDVRTYLSHSATPVDHGASHDNQIGVVKTVGKPDAVVDLTTPTGFASDDFSQANDQWGPTDRYLATELRGVSNRDETVIHELDIDGVA